MVDEVQVVSGCYYHHLAASLGQTGIGLVQGFVYKHKSIHHNFSVCRLHG